jgi:hypothetical protein
VIQILVKKKKRPRSSPTVFTNVKWKYIPLNKSYIGSLELAQSPIAGHSLR